MTHKMIDECYDCIHMSTVPGNCHIRCRAPDENMKGDPHGIRQGWFFYPFLFDPVWKRSWCANFESKSQPTDAGPDGQLPEGHAAQEA